MARVSVLINPCRTLKITLDHAHTYRFHNTMLQLVEKAHDQNYQHAMSGPPPEAESDRSAWVLLIGPLLLHD